MYRTLHVARHVMPDDRLAHLRCCEDGTMIFEYRAWRIHPALVAAMSELSSDVAASGILDLDPGREAGAAPVFGAYFDLVSSTMVLDQPMDYHLELDGIPRFVMWANRGMVDPSLVRELNDEVLPVACSLLVPARMTALGVDSREERRSSVAGVR